MRRLVALAVLIGLLTAADVAAKTWAQTQVADVTHKHIPGAGPTSATIHSFPFIGRLAIDGTVPQVIVHQQDVHGGPLVFTVITVDLREVKLDRNRLFKKRQVSLTGLGSGTVTAELTESALSQALGVPVTLANGKAQAVVRGVTLSADVAVANNQLLLTPAGLATIRLPIPTVPLLGCASSAEVADGRVRISCTITHVPPELLREANSAIQQP